MSTDNTALEGSNSNTSLAAAASAPDSVSVSEPTTNGEPKDGDTRPEDALEEGEILVLATCQDVYRCANVVVGTSSIHPTQGVDRTEDPGRLHFIDLISIIDMTIVVLRAVATCGPLQQPGVPGAYDTYTYSWSTYSRTT